MEAEKSRGRKIRYQDGDRKKEMKLELKELKIDIRKQEELV